MRMTTETSINGAITLPSEKNTYEHVGQAPVVSWMLTTVVLFSSKGRVMAKIRFSVWLFSGQVLGNHFSTGRRG